MLYPVAFAALLLAADPPFTVSAQRVTSRLDLPTGRANTEIELAVAWPKQAKVYLLDIEPALTTVTLLPEQTLKPPVGSQVPFAPDGSPALVRARLGPVPRTAQRVTRLTGHLHVVYAERMLEVVFDKLATAARESLKRQDAGVVVRLQRLTDRGEGTWIAAMRVEYPAPLPEFESFQSWLPENRIALRRKGLAKLYPAAAYEIDRQGRTVAEATYRFRDLPLASADDLKDWELLYTTPATIQSREIAFDLKDVPLP